MNFEPVQALPLVLISGLLAYRYFRFRKVRKALPDLLAQGALIVDVRTPNEFNGAHHPDSINLPLDRFDSACRDLKKEVPVILCCASGTRSAIAAGVLRAKGFEKVLNAGPWTNVP
jgi:phage shock protein E